MNKPDRPLASGTISPNDALKRLLVSGILGIGIGFCVHIPQFAIIFIMRSFLHNMVGLGDDWLYKNVLCSLGIFTVICASWAMTSPPTPDVLLWGATLSGIWPFFGHVQDLRDLEGDRIIGRKTLPITFGTRFTRRFLGLGLRY